MKPLKYLPEGSAYKALNHFLLKPFFLFVIAKRLKCLPVKLKLLCNALLVDFELRKYLFRMNVLTSQNLSKKCAFLLIFFFKLYAI
jgi:hypothetical protein